MTLMTRMWTSVSGSPACRLAWASTTHSLGRMAKTRDNTRRSSLSVDVSGMLLKSCSLYGKTSLTNTQQNSSVKVRRFSGCARRRCAVSSESLHALPIDAASGLHRLSMCTVHTRACLRHIACRLADTTSCVRRSSIACCSAITRRL